MREVMSRRIEAQTVKAMVQEIDLSEKPKSGPLVRRFYALREELWRRQAGACLVCCEKLSGKPLAIDHDHETGAVRGLLCYSCNTIVGLVEARKPVLPTNAILAQAAESDT
jgi:hypothetical protein